MLTTGINFKSIFVQYCEAVNQGIIFAQGYNNFDNYKILFSNLYVIISIFATLFFFVLLSHCCSQDNVALASQMLFYKLLVYVVLQVRVAV